MIEKKDNKEDTMIQFLQKQPYRLTIAKYNLGIHQMRIMAHIVDRLQPFMSMEIDYTKQNEDIWVTIKVKELVKGNNVKPLREALKGLMKKDVCIMHYLPEKAAYLEIGTSFIKEYKYEHLQEYVDIQISGNLLPQITDLARGYTKYSLNVAFNTSSPNIFKLYQYFSHFRDKKQIQCNVDTLRQWLQLEKKYNLPCDIKRCILDPAKKELKEKADIWFEIAERVTKGRKMIGWKFNIYTKKGDKKKEAPKLLAAPASNKEVPSSEKEQQLVERYGLGLAQAKKLVKIIAPIELNKALHQIQVRQMNNEIRDMGAYSVTFLEKKFDIKL